MGQTSAVDKIPTQNKCPISRQVYTTNKVADFHDERLITVGY